MKTSRKLWIWLGILIAASPLGLIIPEIFKSGSAWGEWSAEKIKDLTGYIPEGLKKLSEIWSAPLPDYGIKSWGNKGLFRSGTGYIISAVIGVSVVVISVFVIGKLLAKKDEE